MIAKKLQVMVAIIIVIIVNILLGFLLGVGCYQGDEVTNIALADMQYFDEGKVFKYNGAYYIRTKSNTIIGLNQIRCSEVYRREK